MITVAGCILMATPTESMCRYLIRQVRYLERNLVLSEDMFRVSKISKSKPISQTIQNWACRHRRNSYRLALVQPTGLNAVLLILFRQLKSCRSRSWFYKVAETIRSLWIITTSFGRACKTTRMLNSAYMRPWITALWLGKVHQDRQNIPVLIMWSMRLFKISVGG